MPTSCSADVELWLGKSNDISHSLDSSSQNSYLAHTVFFTMAGKSSKSSKSKKLIPHQHLTGHDDATLRSILKEYLAATKGRRKVLRNNMCTNLMNKKNLVSAQDRGDLKEVSTHFA